MTMGASNDQPATVPARLFLVADAPGLSRWQPAFYAALRVGFGVAMLTHGLPKALGIPHGSMADPAGGALHLIGTVMGLPFAHLFVVLITLLETVGAAFVVAGFLTRTVMATYVLELIGICYALGPTWPWIDRGMEFPFILMMLALYMMVGGGGRYSVDHVLRAWLQRP